MNTPERTPSEQRPRPAPRDEKGPFEAALDLHPFPALAVEASTGAIVFANEAARRAGLPQPEGAQADSCATGAWGERVEAGQLIQYLLSHGGGADGVEITWHTGVGGACGPHDTPAESAAFRVFCRQAPAADGRSPPAVLTFLDVSRRKAAETELREALEARDEFFSVATHELKDPLFALQLSIQLLRHAAEKQGEVPAYVRQHLEVSHRQADRLASLIDNLLDVSRIMNGRLRVDLEALDLSDLAHEVAARLQGPALSAGSAIEVEAPEPTLGYFDRVKLEQVVGNLLTNAIKYGGGRPVTLRVRGEDGTAVLEVEDRGVGIAPEDRERIFRRFERASDSHKRASLGLGLYIVRSLVEAHGGTVGVRSEPGRGSTFTVRLPRKRLRVTGPEGGGQEATGG